VDRIRGLLIGTVVVVAMTDAGCSSGTTDSTASQQTATADDTGTPTTAVPVVKDVLAQQVDPPGAPGYTLTLARYTIAPGARLSPHEHPGVQLAEIESGTLTYTVETGTATVHRGGATGTAEQVTGPRTTTLGPRDTVAEIDGMAHFGANDTAEPVVIYATLLTEDGDDLSVPVTDTPGTTGAIG
jgi:hypothetical protein